MKKLWLAAFCLTLSFGLCAADKIPLPEHPRPDFERAQWQNLNGTWDFTFNEAAAEKAITTGSLAAFDEHIVVPFPWGSPLSGVKDQGDKAWYGRQVTVPADWRGKRIFLVVGASDWETKAWFNGQYLGDHQGGYTPFAFELTDQVQFGAPQTLVIGAADTSSDQHLNGKQGYGNARGIWQTVYLEARGGTYIDHVHFSPDIDKSQVKVRLELSDLPAKDAAIELTFRNGEQAVFTYKPTAAARKSKVQEFTVPLQDQRLWDLDNPYLYEMTVALREGGAVADRVDTYFGQRKISVVDLPGLGHPYVALNDKPVYMQLTLDQSYHPEGYYTFPTDEFMRNEILLSKRLGLNGNRIHIKVEVPRKLYWADKLGLLIMADVPNFWGEPKEEARRDWEYCQRQMIKRDYNHPAIFSWINFNESWGLWSDNRGYEHRRYAPETQQWVADMYHRAKELDPTRLVEDNSTCNWNHVEATDLNSWHWYLPGYMWEEAVAKFDAETYPGSTYNFQEGYAQSRQPMFNSECGNVWGYLGSAGDSDYTWDYHCMINAFRAHPKVCGWLYTEHHDVINEWNGYVKYDRSPKIDGLSDLVPGMSVADFHATYYISPRTDLCTNVAGGATVTVPLFASFMTNRNPGPLTLKTRLIGWNTLGEKFEGQTREQTVPFEPWLNRLVDAVSVTIPDEKGLYLLQMQLCDAAGQVLHRNFTLYRAKEGKDPVRKNVQLATFDPASFIAQHWNYKQANVLDGLKVNGFGSGYFDYEIAWPAGCSVADLASATLRFEASAKQLFGKDVIGEDNLVDLDFMRGGGTHDPCKSANAYAMTDLDVFDSRVQVYVNGAPAGLYHLEDDPADHRGILSWHAQPQDKRMYEAGSYGYLINAELPLTALREGEPIRIRLEVPESANRGLALYGKDFGRYPLDPTLIFIRK